MKRGARTACTWSLVLEVVLANGLMGTATAQGAKKNKYIPQLQSLLMALKNKGNRDLLGRILVRIIISPHRNYMCKKPDLSQPSLTPPTTACSCDTGKEDDNEGCNEGGSCPQLAGGSPGRTRTPATGCRRSPVASAGTRRGHCASRSQEATLSASPRTSRTNVSLYCRFYR